ncbi:MAG: DUF6807 family protein [Bacteroidia bacterium]
MQFLFPKQPLRQEQKRIIICDLERGRNIRRSEINTSDDKITVSYSDKPVLSYQISTAFPADTLPAYYQRSGFIHPMYSPDGTVLSDDFPKGHTHQHAVFFAWVNAFWQGHKTDFWNQQHGEGTVRNSGVVESISGSVYGRFETQQEHLGIVEETQR